MARPEQAPLTSLPAARADLTTILTAALEAVAPSRLVHAFCATHPDERPDPTRQHVIAVGKAAEGMLAAWTAAGAPRRGLLVTPQAPPSPPAGAIEVVVAAHPVPDRASVEAAQRALALAHATGRHDTLVVLLSGGASSLMALPAPPCTLEGKIEITSRLLRAGVPIEDMNVVRRWLSAIKGGRLAAASGGRVLTLAVSDVVGAGRLEPATIGSGPTVPEPSTAADAMAVLHRAWPGETTWPAGVRERLRAAAREPAVRTVRGAFHVIGSRRTAVAAAADRARALGYGVRVHEPPVVGEARDAGRRLAQELSGEGEAPRCCIWSGETTVTVRGDGRGGRNQELVLAAIDGLEVNTRPWVFASLATDGIDGASAAAGAIADTASGARARALGLDPAVALARNDSAAFFASLGDAIVTGPTGTNVGDLQVALVR